MADSAEPTVPNFEQSLTRLDEIARALEDNKLGLQESLGVYEEGVKLLRSCKAMLETAERQVELLTGFDAAGNPITAPFDDTATIERSARTSTSKNSDAASPASNSDAKLTTESIDVSARTTSTVKKSRKKSPAADSPQSSSSQEGSAQNPTSSSSTSTSSNSSARDSSQLAPWEESADSSENENSDSDDDSKIDESGRLF